MRERLPAAATHLDVLDLELDLDLFRAFNLMLGAGMVCFGVAVVTCSFRNRKSSAKMVWSSRTGSLTAIAAGLKSTVPSALRKCTSMSPWTWHGRASGTRRLPPRERASRPIPRARRALSLVITSAGSTNARVTWRMRLEQGRVEEVLADLGRYEIRRPVCLALLGRTEEARQRLHQNALLQRALAENEKQYALISPSSG